MGENTLIDFDTWTIKDFKDAIGNLDHNLTRHGGAYDRGSADSWYGRGFSPHYYTGATAVTDKVTTLTREERAAYELGWEFNERFGDHKYRR